jgi:signal transduction histidine kinase
MLRWAVVCVGLSFANLVMFVATVGGFVLLAVWVGIPVLLATTRMTRGLADFRRRRVGELLGTPLESPYLRSPEGSRLTRVAARGSDPAFRRDVLWLLVDGLVGLLLATIALAESGFGLVFWWLPPSLAARAHLRLDRALLGVSEKSRLALRVQQLTQSRAETVDTQSAELRRIERDLHDGAQARLVALGMSLALAEQEVARDPDAARALLTEARTTSSDALAELRDLVRGIHPPVLADRGLVGAVQALALAVPLEVEVRSAISGRLPAPVESAAYFAVAEALTNVAKHAGATHASVGLTHDADVLTLAVGDDGSGGADPAAGTGLHGIARRLSAFDGTLTIKSPTGGPTEVVMVLPCASSSPKISPSSGTA